MPNKENWGRDNEEVEPPRQEGGSVAAPGEVSQQARPDKASESSYIRPDDRRPHRRHTCLPVGVPEIAARLEVKQSTVWQWVTRSTQGPRRVHFPAVRWRVGKGPAWCWFEVEGWALQTGRLEHG